MTQRNDHARHSRNERRTSTRQRNDNGTGSRSRAKGRRARLPGGAWRRRSITSTPRLSSAVRGSRCCSSSATEWHLAFGQRRTVPKTAAAGRSTRLTFKRGYVCFNEEQVSASASFPSA